MKAYELRACIDAGLTLTGRENGEYQWIGSQQQFAEARRTIEFNTIWK